jgi:hypothetical protein
VPRRLDFVRFRVGEDELDVAFRLALELAERATRTQDAAARSAAAKRTAFLAAGAKPLRGVARRVARLRRRPQYGR